MAPTKPEASLSLSKCADSPHEDQREQQQRQAGRTTTHLAAQQSSQSLREAARSRRGPIRYASEPSLSQTTQVHLTTSADDSTVATRTSPDQQPLKLDTRFFQPHQPTVPSPLNPTVVSSRTPNASGQPLPGSSSDVRHHTPTVDPTSATFGPGPELVFALRPALNSTASHLTNPSEAGSSSPLLQSCYPRSVRDLGSDYTRYFDPMVSRKAVTGGPNQSPPNSSGTAGDVNKQNFNPFRNTNGLSNPFASGHGTPTESLRSGRSSSHGAISVPFKSRPPSYTADADPEKNAFYEYLDDRFGAPHHGYPLITDMKEEDDDMHMPRADDDKRLKPRFRDHFTRDNISSTLGLFLMVAGLLTVFVILPVLSYTGVEIFDYEYNTPLGPADGPAWAHVNDNLYPLLTNVRTGLIDPDTPQEAMTRVGVDGETLKLVFSDEFNEKNRTFYPGDDAYWFGFDGWYGATEDLEWYDPDAINTGDGALLLQMDKFASHNLDFRSGMINSWNQLCFKGGIFEVSVSLPGPAGVHGLWPGVWTMGNLGRPGYLATTDGMWPYTYDTCDSGITPNQSMIDGTSKLPGQRLPSCACPGQDHPTPGTGRGAPEIDIAEVSADWGGMGVGVATQSYQVAPFDIWYYPNYDFMEIPDYSLSFVNTYTGGPFQQAISTTTMLNNDWYDGKKFQKFAYEYVPGEDSSAFVAWTISDQVMMRFDARAIGPNGNIGQRIISEEPMSIIMNLGISNNWVDIQWSQLTFPTVLRIDYVRWYQREGYEIVTCDPPGYETTEYIKQHPVAYNNPNVTHWKQAGYDWPTNSYMDECST